MKGVYDMAKPNEKTVVSAVNKLNVAFRQKFENISELEITNSETEMLIKFSVADVAEVEWTYGKNSGLLKIRSTSHPQGLDDEELYDLGNEVTENNDDLTPTSYDSNLVLQAVYEIDEDEEINSEREIFNVTMKFVQTLVINRKKLRGKANVSYAESDEEVQEEEQDVFGFDDFVVNEDGSLELVTEDGTVAVTAAIPDKEEILEPDESEDGNLKEDVPAEIVSGEPLEDEMEPTPENAELASMIEKLSEDISSDAYNPDDYQDEAVEDAPAFYMPAVIADLPNTAEMAEKALTIRDDARTYLEALTSRSKVLFSDIGKLVESMYQAADLVHQKTQEADANITARSFQLQNREAKISDDMTLLEKEKAELAAQRTELDVEQKSLAQRQNAVEHYAANLQAIDSRQKDMQIQLQSALQENSVLQEQLKTAQHQAEESQAQIASMLEEGPNHSAYRTYVSDLRKKNAFQGKRITALDERVTTALGIIDTLQKENSGLREKEALWLKQERELKKKLAEPKMDTSYVMSHSGEETAAQAAELKLQMDDLTRDLTMARDRAAEVERDFEAEREKNRDLSEQLRSAKTDLESAKVETAKLTEELNSARLALTKAGALNDVNLLAGSVKEELSDIGIHAEVIPGEMDMLVGGSYKDVYQISVDVHNRIIYVEKKLKKAKKYKGMVDELNQMDIRTAYTLQEDCVCCKAFCHNLDQITTLLLELISKMDKMD